MIKETILSENNMSKSVMVENQPIAICDSTFLSAKLLTAGVASTTYAAGTIMTYDTNGAKVIPYTAGVATQTIFGILLADVTIPAGETTAACTVMVRGKLNIQDETKTLKDSSGAYVAIDWPLLIKLQQIGIYGFLATKNYF